MDNVKKAWKYIFNGHFIVSLVRWLVLTGGNIGESAFLLATLWVTLNAVAHVMLTWFLSTRTIELFNYLSLVAFSLLPELIIIPLIATCYNHWDVLAKDGKRKDALVWALLYTLPAIVFLLMTIFTVSQFVNTGGSIFTPATGMQLVIRALFGWMFSAVNMLFAELGKPNYANKLQDLQTALAEKQAELEQTTLHFEAALQTANSNFQLAMQSKQSEFEYRLNEIEDLKNQIACLKKKQTQNSEGLHLVRPSDESVRTLLLDNPKQSVRSVAKKLGVAPSTAHKRMKGVRIEEIHEGEAI